MVYGEINVVMATIHCLRSMKSPLKEGNVVLVLSPLVVQVEVCVLEQTDSLFTQT